MIKSMEILSKVLYFATAIMLATGIYCLFAEVSVRLGDTLLGVLTRMGG